MRLDEKKKKDRKKTRKKRKKKENAKRTEKKKEKEDKERERETERRQKKDEAVLNRTQRRCHDEKRAVLFRMVVAATKLPRLRELLDQTRFKLPRFYGFMTLPNVCAVLSRFRVAKI